MGWIEAPLPRKFTETEQQIDATLKAKSARPEFSIEDVIQVHTQNGSPITTEKAERIFKAYSRKYVPPVNWLKQPLPYTE